MRLLTLVIALIMPAAHGQWGIGSALGNTCSDYGPAAAAFDNNDEVRNLRGQYAQGERQLALKRQRLARTKAEVNEAKRDMKRVLSQRVIDVITEHRIYNRGRNSYQRACPADSRASSEMRVPGRGGGGADSNLPPTPVEFCYTDRDSGKQVNTWLENFAMEDGQTSETVCNYKIPGWGTPNSQDSGTCRRGLREYDNLIAEEANLEQEIADLDSQLRGYRRRLNRIADDLAEGRPCLECMAQQRGQSTIGTSDQMLGLAGVALMMMMSRNNQQPRPPVYGAMPMPYGGGFPGQPYVARIPGYMGVGPGGVYGGVPGAVGPGAFRCQGTNPMMAGNGFAPPINPMLVSPYLANPMLSGNPASPLFAGQPGAFGQPNLFSNPFSMPFMNPGFQNPLLNNGFGPGFMPMLGNGVPGYQMNNPLAQMYNPFQNAYAPSMLPYLGGDPFGNPMMQHPYFNQGYQFNPYYNPNNGGLGPYGSYAGGAPYAIPLGGGVPGYQMPYGGGGIAAPYGSPLANYNMQMDQLNRNIQMISAGSSWNPNAPAVLPFPGPGLNPYYRQPTQPPLPQPPPQPQPMPPPLSQPRLPAPPILPPTGPLRTR
jgi:hypothetical protein